MRLDGNLILWRPNFIQSVKRLALNIDASDQGMLRHWIPFSRTGFTHTINNVEFTVWFS